MDDFFDQSTGANDGDGGQAPEGASILVNGSYRPMEVDSSLISAVKSVALEAGFGKFRVFLNGAEVKPSTVGDRLVESSDKVEIRPYDEAG